MGEVGVVRGGEGGEVFEGSEEACVIRVVALSLRDLECRCCGTACGCFSQTKDVLTRGTRTEAETSQEEEVGQKHGVVGSEQVGTGYLYQAIHFGRRGCRAAAIKFST